VSVIDAFSDSLAETPSASSLDALFGEGLVIMKLHRSPAEATAQGDLIIARRNPSALWLSDYEDRIIYDGRKQGAAKYAGLIETLKAAAEGVAMTQAKAA
jgi:hypothetical protein